MVALQRIDIQEQYEGLPVDTVIHGDCLEVLKTFPDNSVSAIVTDPPAGIGFMMSKKSGRTWDSDKGGRTQWIAWLTEIMAECLRVIRPGGHALVWSLPRTSHWTGMALEDAGWQVRDVIYNLVSGDTKLMQFLNGLNDEQRNAFTQLCESTELRSILHINGSGFPKSHNISAAIDREMGLERKVLGYQDGRGAYDGSIRIPREKFTGNVWNNGEVGGTTLAPITDPASEMSQRYSGFGSALKPSVENWILVRKPLSEKNIAQNVLRWNGCGSLNIDATRVGIAEDDTSSWREGNYTTKDAYFGGSTGTPYRKDKPQGRFPSNLLLSHDARCIARGTKRVRGNKGFQGYEGPHIPNVLSDGGLKQRSTTNPADEHGLEEVQAFECVEECPVRVLGEQSGERKSGASHYDEGFRHEGLRGNQSARITSYHKESDTGTAARYFQQFHDPLETLEAPFHYFSKASKRDRDAGSEGMPEGQSFDKNTSKVIQRRNPDTGETTYSDYKPSVRHNIHPTVKQVHGLMCWLVKLVTPPGGIVLDPFCGSGSTLCAAVYEGMHFIGIEQSNTPDAPYVDIARARIAHAQQEANCQKSEQQEEYICVEECPIKVLDAQSGIRKSGGKTVYANTTPTNNGFLKGIPTVGRYTEKGVGGAARYFQQFPPEPVSLWNEEEVAE